MHAAEHLDSWEHVREREREEMQHFSGVRGKARTATICICLWLKNNEQLKVYDRLGTPQLMSGGAQGTVRSRQMEAQKGKAGRREHWDIDCLLDNFFPHTKIERSKKTLAQTQYSQLHTLKHHLSGPQNHEILKKKTNKQTNIGFFLFLFWFLWPYIMRASHFQALQTQQLKILPKCWDSLRIICIQELGLVGRHWVSKGLW